MARDTIRTLPPAPEPRCLVHPQSSHRVPGRIFPMIQTQSPSHLPPSPARLVPAQRTLPAPRAPPVATGSTEEKSLPATLPPAHTPAASPLSGTHIWQIDSRTVPASPDSPVPLHSSPRASNSDSHPPVLYRRSCARTTHRQNSAPP